MYSKDKSVVLRGLCDTNKEAFFPKYVYDLETTKEDEATRERLGPRNTPRQGRELGSRIDGELTAVVDKKSAPKVGWHPYVQRILKLLRQRGYRLLATQVPVGCIRARVYTAVDLVLEPIGGGGNGGVVLTEIKCREPDTLQREYKSAPYLQAPFACHLNNVFNHDQLQTGGAQLCFEETFPRVPVLASMVLYVHRAGIDSYPLKSWVLTDRDRVVRQWSAARRNQKSRRRRVRGRRK